MPSTSQLLIYSTRETLRQAFRNRARDAGFPDSQVLQATTEQSALEILNRHVIQFAICDIELEPQGSSVGFRLMRHLRNQSFQCIIICVITGGNDEVAVGALQAGATDFINTQSSVYNNWAIALQDKLRIYKRAAETSS
jgi:DNA-binding NtrC family response regulator